MSLPKINNLSQKEFKIDAVCGLFQFLLEANPHESRTTVKSWLTHRSVSVNNVMVTLHSTVLHPGDVVSVAKGRMREALDHPMLKMVFEDDYIIVVDKCPGLLSIGTDKERDRTAYRILSDHCKRSDPSALLFVLHRLDRDTSGLMMFAKSQQVQDTMQRNWKTMVCLRQYTAVAEGLVRENEGIISAPLAENKAGLVYVCRGDEGAEAVTRFRVVSRGVNSTLLELELDTGRKNQIRAHLRHIGHPVAGDIKYGGHKCAAGRLCLHAGCLCFIHPVTGRRYDFNSPMPAEFGAEMRRRYADR